MREAGLEMRTCVFIGNSNNDSDDDILGFLYISSPNSLLKFG